MKKLMFVAALAASMVATADITSNNIVGYQAKADVAEGNFFALAVQFENVSGGQIAVKDLVKVADPSGGASISTATDQIWIWDTSAADWVKYYLYKKPRSADAPYWCKADETTETTDTIGSGTTFFFSRGGTKSTSLTLSGQVRKFEGSQQYTVNEGDFLFMAYPWPMDLAIGGFEQYQGSPSGGASISTATDQIWRWNTTKADWDKYYCYKKPRSADAPYWCKADETTETTDKIPSGEGFFFTRGGTKTDTITFPAPEM